MRNIYLKGVKVHNLKNIDLTLPQKKLIVFTGISGSGKSSLAFDTIYIEGQRRYIESLSHHVRRYLGDFPKPDAEKIEGISPTIAIEQKTAGKSPRSTVGTMTGIYDFLRVLFAKIAIPHCPVSKEPLAAQSKEKIIKKIENYPPKSKIILLAPYARNKKGEFKEDFAHLLQKGFTKLRIDGEWVELSGSENLDGTKGHDIDIVIDRLIIEKASFSRLAEGVTLALEIGKGIFSVLATEEVLFSQHAYSPKSGLSYKVLEPHDFSFNHIEGMCEHCHGLGTSEEFDLNKIIDPNLSIKEDACHIASSYNTVRYGNIYENLAKIYDFDTHTPWKNLKESAKQVFLYGTKEKWTRMRFTHPHKKIRWTEFVRWRGVLYDAKKRLIEAKSDLYRKKMLQWMKVAICPSCQGARIKSYPAHATLGEKTIFQITQFTLKEAYDFFSNLPLSEEENTIAEEPIKEIQKRLSFLKEVGLGYLTLERTSPTLSGGEAQRVRLAAQIGNALVGATYVLDEPSIGLHPEDHHKLIATLKLLKEMGNTVIVVEHDRDTILAADVIVDFGPGAGKEGGEILSHTDLKSLIDTPRSITAKYLTYEWEIPIPKRRKLQKQGLKILGAKHHNLQNIDVSIPLQGLIGITGLSGSGKSSLISDTLFPALSNYLHHSNLPVGEHKIIEGISLIDKVIEIDQSPIGRTPRSNPATYIQLFEDIRDLFASLPESKAQGFHKGHFSFNVKTGSCPYCGGIGSVRMDMDFMEDVWIECVQCKGKRFEPQILGVKFHEKNIYDILQMDVTTALKFFENIPSIAKKLSLLQKVGLGYLSLGQPSTTLSGGEAQRIKLAKELIRPPYGNTLYILDEPSTGLHFHDLKKLLEALADLIDLGNTAIVIEHNMEVIKTADWIIDLGPGAGIEGGKIHGMGTPETLCKLDTPTGRALLQTLQKKTPPFSPSILKETPLQPITIVGAKQHNLKNIHLTIPHNQITVFTGPSGSGKTSLAFDTIYVEGQRRYLESLSSYAKSFVKQSAKPDVENIFGLAPTIAIEQHKGAVNPRSTIGTITEIYDLLRLLYAHAGIAHCPETGEEIKTISKEFVLNKVMDLSLGEKIHILAPIPSHQVEILDTLRKEGFLRIRLNSTYYELDQEIPLQAGRKNELFLVIDRLVIQKNLEKRLLEAIGKAVEIGKGMLVIAREKEDLFYNLSFAVEKTGKSYPPILPQTFSFNDERGMCPDCLGLGVTYDLPISEDSPLMEKSLLDIATELFKEKMGKETVDLLYRCLGNEIALPLQKVSKKTLHYFLQGGKRYKKFVWRGLQPSLASAAKSLQHPFKNSLLVAIMKESSCPSCQGSRLNPLARHVTLNKVTLPHFCSLPIKEAATFLLPIEAKPYLQEILQKIQQHLQFLLDIGLHYLSLDRSAPTLSGGELQRIRLSKQLGSGLTSCIYILDEPTIGLHPHNNRLLNEALKKLQQLGNTLLLVEHDPMTIAIADHIVDFGPKAGKEGGRVLAQGSYQEILQDENSLTGAYLSHKKKIPVPSKRRPFIPGIAIHNANIHNLKNLHVDIPIEAITCLSGVSGSGKSSLMHYVLLPMMQKNLPPQFDKLIVVNQSPIGSTPRSDVSSYSDILTPLRYFYASLKLAKAKGLQPRHFSYHHKRGMCKTCQGFGYKKIDLQFLPAVEVACEECKGFRLNPISLLVTYKDKHLGEVLKLTVKEAKDLFSEIPTIYKKLEVLISVGLSYLQLGQTITTLSGGEAQRLRLSKELMKRSTGKTLYLIDEPSVGLHSVDIDHLLPIFHKLADQKNTLIIIEHNLDILANADYIIDLGPGAGEEGGKVIATGTPEEISSQPNSFTGRYLNRHLSR